MRYLHSFEDSEDFREKGRNWFNSVRYLYGYKKSIDWYKQTFTLAPKFNQMQMQYNIIFIVYDRIK